MLERRVRGAGMGMGVSVIFEEGEGLVVDDCGSSRTTSRDSSPKKSEGPSVEIIKAFVTRSWFGLRGLGGESSSLVGVLSL